MKEVSIEIIFYIFILVFTNNLFVNNLLILHM